jgi:hypothetical protein
MLLLERLDRYRSPLLCIIGAVCGLIAYVPILNAVDDVFFPNLIRIIQAQVGATEGLWVSVMMSGSIAAVATGVIVFAPIGIFAARRAWLVGMVSAAFVAGVVAFVPFLNAFRVAQLLILIPFGGATCAAGSAAFERLTGRE